MKHILFLLLLAASALAQKIEVINSTTNVKKAVTLSGGGTISVGGVITLNVSGTANEITATPSGGAVALSLPAALTFTGKTITGGTFASPTLTTPALGTPSALVLTNATGFPTTQKFARKTGDTSRNTTTTFAADPHLTVALTAGTWQVEVFVAIQCATGTPGAKMRMAYTGTRTGTAGGYIGHWDVSSYPHVALMSPDYSGGEQVFTGLGNTQADFFFVAKFITVVSDSGNLTVDWAQNVSSGDATVARTNSWMLARQVQ